MKYSSNQKTTRTTQSDPSQLQTPQRNGQAIKPPASGIDMVNNPVAQRMPAPQPTLSTPAPENKTGLPDNLKAGIETLSGYTMDDVRVHYNSPKPARLQALAYTQGTDIHVGPRQERHLPHEAWHVVQQKQRRVTPAFQTKGVGINDDPWLEAEADQMSRRAVRYQGPVQTKKGPIREQNPAPFSVSAPRSAGNGSYKIAAGAAGQQVGSVMVHDRDETSVEVTDLKVDPAHRRQGLGKALMASALRAGNQLGKSKVRLASQDNGSGRLTGWYEDMGFQQGGVNQFGYPQLEAPINRVLSGVAQRRVVPLPDTPLYKSAARGSSALQLKAVQMMELRPRAARSTRPASVPEGYMNLNDFDKATSYKWNLASRVSNPNEIYAKLYKGKVFLWWESPETQVDDFVYFGDRDADIKDCKENYGDRRGYTWHHTGYPHEEDQGTMQLVPTDEHEALPHVGGIAISQGKI